MLVEIPDPEVILGIVLAFFGGLFVFYIFYKVKPGIDKRTASDSAYLDRLEFYERQLIDMKIRLDSLGVGGFEVKSGVTNQIEPATPEKKHFVEEKHHSIKASEREKQNFGVSNMVNYVLGLITEKPMTSRDIQTASHRSREHTSRLMNKLFKEGFVERDTKTKPYTYSITDKGRGKITSPKLLQETVV